MCRIAPPSARWACHPQRSPNMPKRPQGFPLIYRRRRLDSLNPCSISFSDQFPAGGGADRKRETVFCRRRYEMDNGGLFANIGFSRTIQAEVASFDTLG